MSRHFSNQAAIFLREAIVQNSPIQWLMKPLSYLKSALFCIHSSSHSSGVYSDNM